MSFIIRQGPDLYLDGKKWRFLGGNQYTFIINFMSQANAAQLFAYGKEDGLSVFRTWALANFFISVIGNNLVWNEAAFVQMDMIFDEARKAGIKMWISLADNPTYNTKLAFVNWANAIFGTSYSTAYPYTSFWDAPECRVIYRQFINKILNRVNTINGRVYKDDDTFAFIELINEGRYDLFTSEAGTQNTASSQNIANVRNWVVAMTTYIKSISTNQLIAYGDCGHTWQWVNGDTVSNGSGYGVDYNIFAAIPNLDILDFHLYPTQANPMQLQSYGQRLGKNGGGAGFVAQVQDYINAGLQRNKPVVISEISLLKEYQPTGQGYPLDTRFNFCKQFFQDFFGAGGDGIIWWSYSMGNAGYELYAGGSDGPNANPNFDDNPMRSLFAQWSYKINGGRIPISAQHSGVII